MSLHLVLDLHSCRKHDYIVVLDKRPQYPEVIREYKVNDMVFFENYLTFKANMSNFQPAEIYPRITDQ